MKHKRVIPPLLLISVISILEIFFVSGWFNPPVNQVTVSFGKPAVNYVTIQDTLEGTRFPGSETIPITLKSQSMVSVDLTAYGVPPGAWVHFSPSSLVSNPNGTVSEMTIAGLVEPFGPSPQNSSIFVEANYQGRSSAVPLIVVNLMHNISILHSIAPVNFTSPLIINPNASSTAIYAVVYDPSSPAQSPLLTKFTVEGWVNNGILKPLPKGLQVFFQNSSISLDNYDPAYFLVAAKGSSLALGSYDILIAETVGGSKFFVHLQVIAQAQEIT